MHYQPVGPHPRGSCQLAFGNSEFGDVIPWLNFHRNGLTVLVHTMTGDDLADHTTYAFLAGRAGNTQSQPTVINQTAGQTTPLPFQENIPAVGCPTELNSHQPGISLCRQTQRP